MSLAEQLQDNSPDLPRSMGRIGDLVNHLQRTEYTPVRTDTSAQEDLFSLDFLAPLESRPRTESQALPGQGLRTQARTDYENRAERSAISEFQNNAKWIRQMGLEDTYNRELAAANNETFMGSPAKFTEGLFDWLQSGNFAAAGFYDTLKDTSAGMNPWAEGDWAAAFKRAAVEFGDAFTPDFVYQSEDAEKMVWGDVLREHYGAEDTSGQWFYESGTAFAGFVLDVLTDPLTYTGYGVGKSLRLLRGVETVGQAERWMRTTGPAKKFRSMFMPNSLLKGLAKGDQAEEIASYMNAFKGEGVEEITAESVMESAEKTMSALARKESTIATDNQHLHNELMSLFGGMSESELRLAGTYLLDQPGWGKKIFEQVRVNGQAMSDVDRKRITDGVEQFKVSLDKWFKAEEKAGLLSPGQYRADYAMGVKSQTDRSAALAKLVAKIRFGDHADKFMDETRPGFSLTSEFGKAFFEKGKQYPTLESRLLSVVDTEQNIALMGARRGLESIRRVNTKQFIDGILKDERIALKIDHATAVNKHSQQHRLLNQHGMKVWSADVGDLGETVHYALPEALVDTLKSANKVFADPNSMNGFVRKFKDVQTIWKSYALMSPGYHMRNMYSNVFLNMLGGVYSPKKYAEGLLLQVEDTRNLPTGVQAAVEGMLGGHKTIDDYTFINKNGDKISGRDLKAAGRPQGVDAGGLYAAEGPLNVEKYLMGEFSRTTRTKRGYDIESLEKEWGSTQQRQANLTEVIKKAAPQLSKQRADSLAAMYDVVAARWAITNGKAPNDFFNEKLTDILQGLPPGIDVDDAGAHVLFQSKKVSSKYEPIRLEENINSKVRKALTGPGSILDELERINIKRHAAEKPEKILTAGELLKKIPQIKSSKGGPLISENELWATGLRRYLERRSPTEAITRVEVDTWLGESWNTSHKSDIFPRGPVRVELKNQQAEYGIDGRTIEKAISRINGYKDDTNFPLYKIKDNNGTTVLELERANRGRFSLNSPQRNRPLVTAGDPTGQNLSKEDVSQLLRSYKLRPRVNHSEYKNTIPGGENYDEWVIRWDAGEVNNEPWSTINASKFRNQTDVSLYEGHMKYKRGPDRADNVIAHIRTKDYYVGSGDNREKVLLILENQSDWTQSLGKNLLDFVPKPWRITTKDQFEKLKKEGKLPTVETFNKSFPHEIKYSKGRARVVITATDAQKREIISRSATARTVWEGKWSTNGADDARRLAVEELNNTLERHAIPDSPFHSNDKWIEVSAKVMSDRAIRMGYDRIAWVSDESQIKAAQNWAAGAEEASDGVRRAMAPVKKGMARFGKTLDGLRKDWGSDAANGADIEKIELPVGPKEASEASLNDVDRALQGEPSGPAPTADLDEIQLQTRGTDELEGEATGLVSDYYSDDTLIGIDESADDWVKDIFSVTEVRRVKQAVEAVKHEEWGLDSMSRIDYDSIDTTVEDINYDKLLGALKEINEGLKKENKFDPSNLVKKLQDTVGDMQGTDVFKDINPRFDSVDLKPQVALKERPAIQPRFDPADPAKGMAEHTLLQTQKRWRATAKHARLDDAMVKELREGGVSRSQIAHFRKNQVDTSDALEEVGFSRKFAAIRGGDGYYTFRKQWAKVPPNHMLEGDELRRFRQELEETSSNIDGNHKSDQLPKDEGELLRRLDNAIDNHGGIELSKLVAELNKMYAPFEDLLRMDAKHVAARTFKATKKAPPAKMEKVVHRRFDDAWKTTEVTFDTLARLARGMKVMGKSSPVTPVGRRVFNHSLRLFEETLSKSKKGWTRQDPLTGTEVERFIKGLEAQKMSGRSIVSYLKWSSNNPEGLFKIAQGTRRKGLGDYITDADSKILKDANDLSAISFDKEYIDMKQKLEGYLSTSRLPKFETAARARLRDLDEEYASGIALTGSRVTEKDILPSAYKQSLKSIKDGTFEIPNPRNLPALRAFKKNKSWYNRLIPNRQKEIDGAIDYLQKELDAGRYKVVKGKLPTGEEVEYGYLTPAGEKLMQRKGKQVLGGIVFRGADNVAFDRSGSAVMYAGEAADVHTFIHEMGHLVRRLLVEPGDEATINRWAFGDKVYDRAVREGTGKELPWGRAEEEKFAKAFENYFKKGVPPHGFARAMEGPFSRLKEDMEEVYMGMQKSGQEFSPEVEEAMRRYLGRGMDPNPEELQMAKATVQAVEEFKRSDIPFKQRLKSWAHGPTVAGRPLTQWNQAIGRAFENNARWAHFIQKWQDGSSVEEAGQSVKRFLFDYNELTDFERDVMKTIIPFYTWMRKNIPLQIEMMIERPEFYAKIPKIMQEVQGMSDAMAEDNGNIPTPDYFDEINAVRLPWDNKGQPTYLAQDLPFQDLNKLNYKDMLSTISPFIKVWNSLIIDKGYDFFLESPIEQFAGEPNVVDLFGEQMELPWGKKVTYAAKQLLPPVAKGLRFAEKASKGRAEDQLFRELLGLSVTSVDVDAVVRAKRYKHAEISSKVRRKMRKRMRAFGLEEALKESGSRLVD